MHVDVVRLQTGVAAGQLASLMHCPQTLPGAQKLPRGLPVQSAATTHSTHWPATSLGLGVPVQSAATRSRQLPFTPQTGARPFWSQSALVRHWTHWPLGWPALAQNGLLPVQSLAAQPWHEKSAPLALQNGSDASVVQPLLPAASSGSQASTHAPVTLAQ
jgi:hypothetical protein